jgi:ankyrin repeat protein
MRRFTNLTLIVLPFFLFVVGCSRGGDTVRHGNLTYDVTEVFGAGTPALALAEAAGRGDANEINRLVAAGANVNVAGEHDITPLWWAIWTRNLRGYEALLDKDANPNAKRAEQYSIMYLAADMEDSKFLAAALKHGGNPNLLDGQSARPPLYPAILNGYNENIDLLLAAKADLNWQDSISGETFPMVAIAARIDYKLVYKLFQNGADLTLKDRFGNTLADSIELVSINASNNDDPLRAKILEILKSKGVTAHKSSPKK